MKYALFSRRYMYIYNAAGNSATEVDITRVNEVITKTQISAKQITH